MLIISNKFAIFKNIEIAKMLIIVEIFWCVTSLSILFTTYVALLKPTLNEQKDFEVLTLFRNGVTWIPTSISC